MSLVINNNLQAANVAANLNSHYGRLATSTRRLSSGLRINSAADDAAGLAIREMQRSDIAALNQGARNANDAISLLQVADGSLGIIDEKLIRMKELAEQAATGTYDSTQRLMIESEYQAMASEITRIANATDFNGLKLLDGSLEGIHDGSEVVSQGKMKIHFGTGNDSAEDYYYIEIGECTSQALGLGNASTWQDVQSRAAKAFRQSLQKQIAENAGLTDEEKAKLTAAIDSNVKKLNAAITNAVKPSNAIKLWNSNPDEGFMLGGKIGDFGGMQEVVQAQVQEIIDYSVNVTLKYANRIDLSNGQTVGAAQPPHNDPGDYDWFTDYVDPATDEIVAYAVAAGADYDTIKDLVTKKCFSAASPYVSPPKNKTRFEKSVSLHTGWMQTNSDFAEEIQRGLLSDDGRINQMFDALSDREQQKLLYAWGQAAIYNLAHADPARKPEGYGIGMPDAFDFGQDVDAALGQAMLEQALDDMYNQIGHMDFAGYTIATQEDAQQSLTAITNAIASKDNVRARLGALQNRLENTVSNLTIQAENLQAAESRISDVDVAQEMTEFVRSQILSQSAVAMLGQANSLPQMAMQVIGS